MRLAIEQRIKQSSKCAVMADKIPDISVVDQTLVAVRYIDHETCKPEERLVKVTEALDKSGAGFAASIISSLKSGGVPLSTVQFQIYDSTASMSGCRKGAQQILSESLG